MMSLLMIASVLLYSITPMKLSMMIVMTSLMFSATLASLGTSMFTASATIISFSSGMMILFCYCSTFSSHEEKTKSHPMWMLMLLLMMSGKENTMEMPPSSSNMFLSQESFLVTAMMMVVLAMMCINKSMFNPTKNMNISY